MTPARLGLAAGAALLLAFAAAAAVIFGGLFDVRAIVPHSRPVAWALHTTMIHAARRHAGSEPPPLPLNPATIRAGFVLYDRNCAGCHGAPGVARAAWVAGMNPSPPFLIDASRQFTPRELTWIVANGIKMTGMPAWSVTMSPDEIARTVVLLRALPTMSAEDYARWRRETALPSPGAPVRSKD